MKHYDLILVYTSHRRHENYLTIIRELSPQYSVGILRFEPKHKWSETEQRFLDMCIEEGGEFVQGESTCHSLIISRFGGKPGRGYYKDILEDMPQYIHFEHLLVISNSIMSGVPVLEDICRKLGTPKILVQSRHYFGMYEPETLEIAARLKLEVVEVGQPYSKYPVFENFQADYLVAYPSHVSVVSHCQHYLLLKNIINVLFSLPKDAKIVVKPHNIRDEGNRLSARPSRRTMLARVLGGLPMSLNRLILKCSYLLDFRYKGFYLFKYLPGRLINLFILIQNEYVFQRCNNLLEHYPAFGLEHYLRGVSKGLITGLSNSIFGALMHKVPICNCDPGLYERPANYQTMIDKFGVDKWNGFSTEGFDLIDDDIRDADLIKYLKKVSSPRCAL